MSNNTNNNDIPSNNNNNNQPIPQENNESVFGETLRHNIAELQRQESLTAQDAFNVLTHSFALAAGAMNQSASNAPVNSPLLGATAPISKHDSVALAQLLESLEQQNQQGSSNNNGAGSNMNSPSARRGHSVVISDDENNNAEAADGSVARAHRESLLDFARTAVEDYGYLDPMELAMLQAEQNTTQDEKQQVSAAEILAVIQTMNEKEFALLSEATNKQLKTGLENHLMYNGSAWYLPQITDCKEDEEQTTCSFTGGSISFALCGKKISIPLISMITRLVTLVAAWFLLWLALPSGLMVPGGYVFDPIACFLICAVIGGILGRVFGIPPLVFVLGFAILWTNVPEPKALTGGIVKEVRTIISRVGLSIILLRSGLSMSWKTIKPATGTILTMAWIPMLLEIIVHGYTASSVMDYGGDMLWPFLQAITCAPGAAAVVGATVLLMRTWGYGTTRGPGVILVPGVVLDMVLGVWAINFMVSIVFRDQNANLGWIIGQGPLQIFLGPVIGMIIGFLWFQVLKVLFAEAKVLPHGKYCKAFVSRVAHTAAVSLTILGLLLVFFGYKYKIAGGGALACVFLAATAQYLMTLDDAPEHFKTVKTKIYTYLTSSWDLLVMPALFSVAASSITVKTMFAGEFVGKAFACIFAGIGARIVGCLICTWNYDMTISERIITVIVSAGRATVQVALGPLALTEVANLPGGGSPELKKYATQVYDTAILSVLIMTPLSAILLTRVAPKFWSTDAEHARIAKENAEKEGQEMTENKVEEVQAPTSTAAVVAEDEKEEKKQEDNNKEEQSQNKA